MFKEKAMLLVDPGKWDDSYESYAVSDAMSRIDSPSRISSSY